MSKGWWYRASQEQKLAQVDAGIALGLSPLAVARCSGLSGDGHFARVVDGFALYHNRNFGGSSKGIRAAHRANSRRRDARRAYWQGARDLSDDGLATFAADEPEFTEVVLE